MIIIYPETQKLYRAPRYSITVNTTNRTMSLYKDGKYVKYYPIAIGKVVSNGCVRTYNNNIIEIAKLISIGTPVTII